MGGRAWHKLEDDALRAAVARHGVRWRRAALEPALSGRSAAGLRQRWPELSQLPAPAAEAHAASDASAGCVCRGRPGFEGAAVCVVAHMFGRAQ
jgi:hypothetical protein